MSNQCGGVQEEIRRQPQFATCGKLSRPVLIRLAAALAALHRHDPVDVGALIGVTSRQVVGLFLEQLRFEYVPALQRLQGRHGNC